MGSVAEKTIAQPHSVQDGIEGKVCWNRHGSCRQWKPLSAYWNNAQYTDGLYQTCKVCCNERKARKAERAPEQPTAEANQSTALVPVAQHVVPFYDDTVYGAEVIQGNERRLYVALKPVCDRLGIDDKAQRDRCERSELFSMGICKVMMTLQVPNSQAREYFCLDLKVLPLWLATLEPSRLSDDARPVVVRYQRECADVLYRYWVGKQVPASTPAHEPEVIEVIPAQVPQGQTIQALYANLMTVSQEAARAATMVANAVESTRSLYGTLTTMQPAIAQVVTQEIRDPRYYGCVYLVEKLGVRPPQYKIGYTQRETAEERRREIVGQSGIEARILHEIRTDQAKRLETMLHRLYRARRIAGEWHLLSDEEREAIKGLPAYLSASQFGDIERMLGLDVAEQGRLL